MKTFEENARTILKNYVKFIDAVEYMRELNSTFKAGADGQAIDWRWESLDLININLPRDYLAFIGAMVHKVNNLAGEVWYALDAATPNPATKKIFEQQADAAYEAEQEIDRAFNDIIWAPVQENNALKERIRQLEGKS